MMLDIFEDSTQGKWLGLFGDDNLQSPKSGQTI